MDRKHVIEAAAILDLLTGARALRASVIGGKHELRLYALTDKETMDNEIGVDQIVAKPLLDHIVSELGRRLKKLGVE